MKQIDRIRKMNAEELAEEIKAISIHIMICKMQGKDFDIKAWLESEADDEQKTKK